MLNQDKKLKLNNFCSCEQTNEDGHTEPDYCDGECFALDKEYFGEVFQEWLDRNGALEVTDKTPKVLLASYNMNWDKVSGVALIECDHEKVIDALNIRTEWSLEISLSGSDLSIVRRSHDELGASFDVRLVYED